MSNAPWSASKSRKIVRRIVVEGRLLLETPAHFGNGEEGEVVDMPLMVAPHDGKTPLLTGTSIAGALRSYLRAREFGWHAPLPTFENNPEAATALSKELGSAAVILFGGFRMDDNGKQSALIVEDAYGHLPADNAPVEFRSGVRIQNDTRTAKKDFLYNAEFWPAGTDFALRFELLVSSQQDEAAMLDLLAAALEGLENGEIGLGARRRRGFGRCRVTEWNVNNYNLAEATGLLGWLEDSPTGQSPDSNIRQLLSARTWQDKRRTLTITADFDLQGSILIRSSSGDADAPDFVHLHAHQSDGSTKPVLSGTSLAGVLRARALKIANTLNIENSQKFIDAFFGKQIDSSSDKPKASRVWVEESVIQGTPDIQDNLVQNRVKINRFTGGAHDAALYSEQPVFEQAGTKVRITLKLVEPQDVQVGMLLYLLKDLWTGDLPVGGESAIGRGALKGRKATITLTSGKERSVCEFSQQNNEPLIFTQGKAADLDVYQAALKEVSHA